MSSGWVFMVGWFFVIIGIVGTLGVPEKSLQHIFALTATLVGVLLMSVSLLLMWVL